MKYRCKFNCYKYLIFIFALAVGCKKNNNVEPIRQPAAEILINGKHYPTVAIGNQVWTTINYAGPGGMSYDTSGRKVQS